jgi:DNA-binding transcriptional ArsR family regulator
MPGQISSTVDVQEKILEILRQEGAAPVYKLAKSLGLTYGGVQWHIDRLERRGLVYTVRVGGRRYVALKGVDLFAKVTVEDVVEELIRALPDAAPGGPGKAGGQGAAPGGGAPPNRC